MKKQIKRLLALGLAAGLLTACGNTPVVQYDGSVNDTQQQVEAEKETENKTETAQVVDGDAVKTGVSIQTTLEGENAGAQGDGYAKSNISIVAVTVGEDGASHQTFEDIALMRTIPGMVVVNPSDGASAEALLKQVIEMNGPAYVRLGRAAVPMFYDEAAASELKLGKGSCIRQGNDLTIIATGIMVNEAMMAAEELASEGIEARVIDMHTIKPLDEEIIVRAARETGAIVTCEEHSVIGGLGSAVAEVVVKKFPVRMAMVGQQDTFGESGKPDELKAKYKMTAADIVCAALAAVENPA